METIALIDHGRFRHLLTPIVAVGHDLDNVDVIHRIVRVFTSYHISGFLDTKNLWLRENLDLQHDSVDDVFANIGQFFEYTLPKCDALDMRNLSFCQRYEHTILYSEEEDLFMPAHIADYHRANAMLPQTQDLANVSSVCVINFTLPSRHFIQIIQGIIKQSISAESFLEYVVARELNLSTVGRLRSLGSRNRISEEKFFNIRDYIEGCCAELSTHHVEWVTHIGDVVERELDKLCREYTFECRRNFIFLDMTVTVCGEATLHCASYLT